MTPHRASYAGDHAPVTSAHIRCMAAGVDDLRLSGRCNYDIRRRRTPFDAVVRFDAAYSATRRHEKPGHDIYYFGGRGHWRL